MQRVFRFSLVGLLAVAGLTACGDKINPLTITTTAAAPGVVREVTVSPQNVTLNVGDKVTLAASVNADAGVTDRTVTWSSSSTAIATVDATGLVTAVASGNATIKATSKADATVSGAAIVTVAGGGGATASVTISSINQTTCTPTCSSTPANLGAVVGQIDVTLNVDPGSSKLAGVDLILNCAGTGNSATDTVVATQNLTATNLAPEAVEAASAPVTLSYNTATFNATTGATAFKNGTCTLKARARTTTGTTVASSTQTLTLANRDVIVGTVVAAKTATDNSGLSWNGGNVTITAIPVFYTGGRVAATTAITFKTQTQTLTNTAGAAVSAVYPDGDGTASVLFDINNLTDANAGNTIAVNIVDASGQPFSNAAFAACATGAGPALCTASSVLAGAPTGTFPAGAPFRLDTQKPAAGSLPVLNNVLQGTSGNGYINGSFRLVADSLAGFSGPAGSPGSAVAVGANCAGNNGVNNPITCNVDNAGVDKVTVVFQTAPSGTAKTSSTWVNATSTSALAESNTSSGFIFRQITTDALGNADTSANVSFGIDKTAPSSFGATQTAGATNQQLFTSIGASNAGGGYVTSGITDNLSGPSIDPANGLPRVLVAQTRLSANANPSATNLTTMEGRNYTNATSVPPAFTTVSPAQATTDHSPCVVGRFNAAAANAGANALPVFERGGTQIGFCTPIFYDMLGGSVPGAADVAAGSGDSQGGYYTTVIITVDQAGNRSVPFNGSLVEDADNPVVTGIDLPGSITGGSTFNISASATDNVDVVGSWATIGYNGAAMVLRYPITAGPGVAFDNVLARTAAISPSVTNFIRNLAPPTAGQPALSTTTGNNANTLNVGVVDEVNRRGLFPTPPPPGTTGQSLAPVAIAQSTSDTWNPGTPPVVNFNQGFALTASANPIWNCPAPTAGQTTGCGAAGTSTPGATSTIFSATASGKTAVFNNPFTLVTFWFANASGEWVQFASSTASTVTDNGTTRAWTYTFTWDPPATGPDGTSLTPAAGGTISLSVRAIGQTANGDAITTATFTLTINNT